MTTPSASGSSSALPPRDRAAHLQWLLALSQLPTVAGGEARVIAWIRAWAAQRGDLKLTEDAAGNLVISPVKAWGGGKGSRPIFVTAHMDHPAFVVHRIIGPGTLELAFRGGVMDPYFEAARVRIHAATGVFEAVLTGKGDGVMGADGKKLFDTYLAEIEGDEEDHGAAGIQLGDTAVWSLPPAEVDALGLVHTHACDDLSALAAALSAYDTLRVARAGGTKVQDVRLLFTRSEEIGFTGAIAACKLGTMPKNARVIALENSRSFPDSPIGGGPIVRVGDRLSIFSPGLTAACAKRAEEIAGHAATPTAQQTAAATEKGMKWQRKLMAGGACEATVFCTYGYEATCLCLPLGNYHNMANLAEVQAGTYDRERLGPPRIEREVNALSDYEGLVDLLVAIGLRLPEADTAVERIEKLYARHEFVLAEGRPPVTKPKARGGGKPARVMVKKRAAARAKPKAAAGKRSKVARKSR